MDEANSEYYDPSKCFFLSIPKDLKHPLSEEFDTSQDRKPVKFTAINNWDEDLCLYKVDYEVTGIKNPPQKTYENHGIGDNASNVSLEFKDFIKSIQLVKNPNGEAKYVRFISISGKHDVKADLIENFDDKGTLNEIVAPDGHRIADFMFLNNFKQIIALIQPLSMKPQK